MNNIATTTNTNPTQQYPPQADEYRQPLNMTMTINTTSPYRKKSFLGDLFDFD